MDELKSVQVWSSPAQDAWPVYDQHAELDESQVYPVAKDTAGATASSDPAPTPGLTCPPLVPAADDGATRYGPAPQLTMIRHHGYSVLLGIVFIAFGAMLGYRALRLGVRSNPDGTLTVRNSRGTRHLDRSQVEDFRVGTTSTSRLGQRSIQALLRDGTTYALGVTGSLFGLRKQKMAEQIADSPHGCDPAPDPANDRLMAQIGSTGFAAERAKRLAAVWRGGRVILVACPGVPVAN